GARRFHKLANGHAERAGDAESDGECRVGARPLDLTQHGAAHARSAFQRLQRPTALGTKLLYAPREVRSRIRAVCAGSLEGLLSFGFLGFAFANFARNHCSTILENPLAT